MDFEKGQMILTTQYRGEINNFQDWVLVKGIKHFGHSMKSPYKFFIASVFREPVSDNETDMSNETAYVDM